MPKSRNHLSGNPEKREARMSLAARMLDAVDHEILAIVDRVPLKVLAGNVDLPPRTLKAIKYREAPPNDAARAEFGFKYPSVGHVFAYWAERMTQPDFLEPESQGAFWRDMNRAGRAV